KAHRLLALRMPANDVPYACGPNSAAETAPPPPRTAVSGHAPRLRLVGGLLRALARGLAHVESVLSGMEAQAPEGLEDLAGGGRRRRSRRLRPPLLHPGRGAPAVLGGEGRGDRDRQRKSHDDAALACHVPLVGAKGASVKPPRARERRVSIACLLACRRLRSAPMPLGGKLRPGGPLAAALAAGLVVRVARLLRDPLMHPDGPAYLELARALLRGKVLAVLGGYYSPLYPAAVAGLAATGLRLELAGRATALLALRAETGHWQLSPREARLALLTGVPGATTLAEAALRNPAALLARMAEGVARQVLYDATALGPLCAIPFLLGVGAARETR